MVMTVPKGNIGDLILGFSVQVTTVYCTEGVGQSTKDIIALQERSILYPQRNFQPSREGGMSKNVLNLWVDSKEGKGGIISFLCGKGMDLKLSGTLPIQVNKLNLTCLASSLVGTITRTWYTKQNHDHTNFSLLFSVVFLLNMAIYSPLERDLSCQKYPVAKVP